MASRFLRFYKSYYNIPLLKIPLILLYTVTLFNAVRKLNISSANLPYDVVVLGVWLQIFTQQR